MKIFNKLGGIPEKDCYDLIKAISKKNVEIFLKYKEQFIKVGGERLRRDCKLEVVKDFKFVVNKIYNAALSFEENINKAADHAFRENMQNPYPKAMGYVASMIKFKYPDKEVDKDFLHQEVARSHVRFLWDQIEPFAGYSFNLSHAVAYTYITSRLLYLKVHYPLEFYAGLLMLEKDSDKIKEYKTEALIHGIAINGVDINKSGVRFDIYEEENEIYFGLANIKGIGNEVAQKIVDGQPYDSFEHFLRTFGTDASVLKPLIALREFNDANPEILYKYYEDFKVAQKSRTDRARRYATTLEKYDAEMKELLAGYDTLATWDETNLEIWENLFNNDEIAESLCVKPGPNYNQKVQVKFNRWKSLKKLFTKRTKTSTDFAEKEQEAEDNLFTLEKFNLDLCEVKISEELQKFFADKEEAEKKYLGFVWDHLLEKSPGYTGRTFSKFRMEIEECGSEITCGPVEVVVIGYKKRDWKNGKGFSWVLQVEDANGEKGNITVWPDDWTRFEEEFTTAKLLRLSLTPPTHFGFTLDSPPKWKRETLPPKDKDYRVIVLNYVEAKEDPDIMVA
jgi:DNA polymerase III alpha subunit